MKYESNKMQYVSVLRVCSMLLIVLYHSMCFYSGTWWHLRSEIVPLWKVISTPIEIVGLTTFVFISGFLYGYMYLERGKYRNVKSFLLNKFRRLMIPYFFWGILMIVSMPTVQITWINLFTGVCHLWFLMMLFEIFVLMVFFNHLIMIEFSTKYIDFTILIVSFVLLYVWKNITSHHYALGIEATLYYIPAFLVGFFYAKYSRSHDRKGIAFHLFIIGIITLFGLSLIGLSDSNTLYRVPAILVSLSGMILVKNSSVSSYQSNVLNNLDKNSMGIYIFNQIVVFLLLLNPESNLFLSYHLYVGPFLIFIVSLVIPWILSIMFNKNKYITYLIG